MTLLQDLCIDLSYHIILFTHCNNVMPMMTGECAKEKSCNNYKRNLSSVGNIMHLLFYKYPVYMRIKLYIPVTPLEAVKL